MKRFLSGFLFFCILATFGCSALSESGNVVSIPPSSLAVPQAGEPSGKASLKVVFKVPGSKQTIATDGPDLSIIQDITGPGIRVAFILKLINPGNANHPFTELRKEVPVSSGAATLYFSELATTTVVGKIEIFNGSKNGFSLWHGALDLEDGSNTLAVSPIGSGEPIDQVASVIGGLLDNPDYSALIKPKLASGVTGALTQSLNLVGSAAISLLANARELYLANVSSTPSSLANPHVQGAQQFISSIEKYKSQTLRTSSKTSGGIRNEIRAAINEWSWIEDPQLPRWEFETWIKNTDRKYIYWFQDPAGNHYKYSNDTASISALQTASLWVESQGIYNILTLESYSYNFLNQFGMGGYQVHITGYASASIRDSAAPSVDLGSVYRVDSNVLCDVREPYPLEGSISIRRYYEKSVSTITYNGTCVARYAISYSDGSKENFRAIIKDEKGIVPVH
ncbi:MAG: hypothetical protein WA705_24950 [Candidatus Ozemobacteraceae bacterium]